MYGVSTQKIISTKRFWGIRNKWQGGQSPDTQLVIPRFYEGLLIDLRYVKPMFVGFLIDFRKYTKCRVPRLYSGPCCLQLQHAVLVRIRAKIVTTITNCRQTNGIMRKSHTTITRHQEKTKQSNQFSLPHQDDCKTE